MESIKFTDRHKVHIKSRNSKTCESLKREIQAVEVAAQPAPKERSPHPSSFLSDLLFSCTNCSLSTLFSLCGFFVCLHSNGHTPRRRSCFPYLVDHATSSKPTLYGHPAPKRHWHIRPRIGDHTDPANSAKTGIQYDCGPTQTWSRPLAVTPRLARQGRWMRQPRMKRCQKVL